MVSLKVVPNQKKRSFRYNYRSFRTKLKQQSGAADPEGTWEMLGARRSKTVPIAAARGVDGSLKNNNGRWDSKEYLFVVSQER